MFVQLRGSPAQLGRQHGRVLKPLVHAHLDLAIARLRDGGTSRNQARERARAYAAVVHRFAPALAAEIDAVAEGARIRVDDAWILQLRAELHRGSGECSTFTAVSDATANGEPLLAQTLDLPACYTPLMCVMELHPSEGPACLMMAPAGQVSHVGINTAGLGVAANALDCDEWQIGFPRYLLTRCALSCRTVDDALRAVLGLPRAASRNLLLVQGDRAVDVELTPGRHDLISPRHGLIAHTNHYLSESLRRIDRLGGKARTGSIARLLRLQRLLEARRGTLDEPAAWEILSDRAGPRGAAISRHVRESDGDVMTVAAFVSRPAEGRLEVAFGPPDRAGVRAFALRFREPSSRAAQGR